MNNKLILGFSFYLLLITFYSFAQVPQKFNYQGIARDTKGNPMAQQRMTLKLTVLPTADATTGEYEEIQTVTTNEFGLYTLQIGNGTPVNGEMKAVKWETGNKYIKVAIDPKGGNDFVDAGTNQLLSVPYAIYADKAGMAKNAGGDRVGAVNSAAGHVVGDANYLTKFTGLNVIGKSQLYENGINIGIGTTTPASRLHLYSNVVGVQQHLRMQNASTTGAGRFTMYNDGILSYATFSKYGSAYAGGYTGIPTLYPYANLLAFGNNGVTTNDGLGRFLISSGGNIGISMFKEGTSKLKFHADYATENVGIGGNAAPVSRVHMNNTDGTSMDLRLTNNTTGHTITDGFAITQNGDNVSVTNNEIGSLAIGTNNTNVLFVDSFTNVGISTATPISKFHVISNNKDTAILGYSNTSSTSQVGVLGTYNGAGYGIGVKGIGYGGTEPLGNLDIGVYGSAGTGSTSFAIYSKGKLKVEDGSQGIGKIFTSDANGGGAWKNGTYSSPWFTDVDASPRDTTVDGTCWKVRDLPAPELTSLNINNIQITVYFRVGSIGPFPLPYISDAGGATNQINYAFTNGKIFVYRHTYNTCRFNSGVAEAYPGQPVMVGMPQSLEYRYVIQYND